MRWLAGLVVIGALGTTPVASARTPPHPEAVHRASHAAAHAGTGTRAQSARKTPRYIAEFNGQFQYDSTGIDCPNVHDQLSYAGKVGYLHDGADAFPITAGSVSASSDEEGSGTDVETCPQQPDNPSENCSTGLKRWEHSHGHISFRPDGATHIKVTAWTWEWATTTNEGPCADDGQDNQLPIGSASFPVSAIGSATITLHLSYDDDHESHGQHFVTHESGTLVLHRVDTGPAGHRDRRERDHRRPA